MVSIHFIYNYVIAACITNVQNEFSNKLHIMRHDEKGPVEFGGKNKFF